MVRYDDGLYGPKKQDPAIRRDRKLIRRQQEDKHGQATEWIGGILYFSKGRTPVPGVPQLPKPGREAIGHLAVKERPFTPYPGLELRPRSSNRYWD